MSRLTSVTFRGRRSRVVLTPRCWRQVRSSKSCCGRRWRERAGHRGELEVSRNTIAQGRPDSSAEPVCSCAFSSVQPPTPARDRSPRPRRALRGRRRRLIRRSAAAWFSSRNGRAAAPRRAASDRACSPRTYTSRASGWRARKRRSSLDRAGGEAGAAFRLKQCILRPGLARIDVLIGWYHIEIARQHDRRIQLIEAMSMGDETVEPGQLVLELRTRLRVAADGKLTRSGCP